MPEIAWKGELPCHVRPVSFNARTLQDFQQSHKPLPWDDTILQAIHVDMEQNPFTGKPFFNEVIFYHQPSKSLIVTDLFWNYPATDVPNGQYINSTSTPLSMPQSNTTSWELAPPRVVPWGTRAWKYGMDQIYAPFYKKYMITNPTAYQDVCRHIVNKWEVETVIPCHGDILRGRDETHQALRLFFF